MIIWGSTGKEKEVSRGHFFCPQCEQERAYKLIRVARYFTLYFIPLFETENLGEFVKCVYCNQGYKPEVLDYRPPTDYEKLIMVVKAEIETGSPLQFARQKLIGAGGDAAEIDKSIAAIVAKGARHCDNCRLTYLPGIRCCTNCGAALTSTVTSISQLNAPAVSALPPAQS